MWKPRTWTAVFFGILWVGAALAGERLHNERNITMKSAMVAVRAAVDACKEKGWLVSATVVDRSGVVTAVARADGAGPHTLDSSRRKAYTAASLRLGTTKAEAIARNNPDALSLRDIDGFLLLGGGLPIRRGGEVVGGIGVGGAPGGEKDDFCAGAGLSTIGAGKKAGGR
jgi:uncharacterized protein GlcG (DUF336 family)|tara:strand:+ start:49 stop:558 length:510 start_codon:yes stop_codon:yes gene_type:complete